MCQLRHSRKAVTAYFAHTQHTPEAVMRPLLCISSLQRMQHCALCTVHGAAFRSLVVIESALLLLYYEAEEVRRTRHAPRHRSCQKLSVPRGNSVGDQYPWLPFRPRTSSRYQAANCARIRPAVRCCTYEAAGPRQPLSVVCTDKRPWFLCFKCQGFHGFNCTAPNHEVIHTVI